MNTTRLFACAAALLAGTACFHHTPDPENNPAAIAGLHAEQRFVNGDTTWVTRGAGYELVGRTRGDLVLLYQRLDRAAATMRSVFPHDTLATVVAVVRRIPGEGQPFRSPPPVADLAGRPEVELVIADPKARNDEGDNRFGMRALASHDPAMPLIRAWLSQHATATTRTSSRSSQASGDVYDARIPAWAAEMISLLPADSLLDQYTATLAAHQDAIIPLGTYFTMAAPASFEPVVADHRGEEGQGRGSVPSVGGGGMGGRGGRGGGGGGGRGGMGGGGSRGGGGGGGGGRSNAGEQRAPLQPSVLFAAQSSALGKYLSREGLDFIGALMDGQMQGQTVDDVLAKRGVPPIARMETDWRLWLNERASAVSSR